MKKENDFLQLLKLKPEETIDFYLRGTWAKIAKFYNNEAALFGGTMAIGLALLNIHKDGTPSTKLGPKMGMEPTGLTRLLKTMEKENLIVRETSQTDKRVVLIKLTKRGKEMREQSRKHVIAFNTFIQSQVAPKKLATFMEVLKEINTLLEQKNIFEKV